MLFNVHTRQAQLTRLACRIGCGPAFAFISRQVYPSGAFTSIAACSTQVQKTTSPCRKSPNKKHKGTDNHGITVRFGKLVTQHRTSEKPAVRDQFSDDDCVFSALGLGCLQSFAAVDDSAHGHVRLSRIPPKRFRNSRHIARPLHHGRGDSSLLKWQLVSPIWSAGHDGKRLNGRHWASRERTHSNLLP